MFTFDQHGLYFHRRMQPCLPLPLHKSVAQNPPCLSIGYVPNLWHLHFRIISTMQAWIRQFCLDLLVQITVSGIFRNTVTRTCGSNQGPSNTSCLFFFWTGHLEVEKLEPHISILLFSTSLQRFLVSEQHFGCEPVCIMMIEFGSFHFDFI